MGDRPHKSEIHRNANALLRRIGIGHNQGPPLDQSWGAWVWRRAHAKAWKTPPREVALARLRRAEGVGLTYREFTAVLMDRGTQLNTAIIMLPCLVERRFRNLPLAQALKIDRDAIATIARLRGVELLVLARIDGRIVKGDSNSDLLEALNARLDGKVAQAAILQGDDQAGQIKQLVKQRLRILGEAFMVGASFDDADLAEQAGLPLFKWGFDYFAPARA